MPRSQISLTCNPHYRYSRTKSTEDIESRLLSDTLKELISYAVGCMMGRYSIDHPGLIIANQNQGMKHHSNIVNNPRFSPCEEGILCSTSKGWMDNEIAELFKTFLKLTFGTEHFEANLRFIEDALHSKQKRSTPIETYFLKSFYKDHCKMYKKRPIYWMLSSKKRHFNALFYIHRYTPNTPQALLDNHFTPVKTKLLSTMNTIKTQKAQKDLSKRAHNRALKELNALDEILQDLNDFEEHVLLPLVSNPPHVNLDDGVVINSQKFRGKIKIM